MIDYFNYNGITYDRGSKDYQLRLVCASGEKKEIPLRLGRELVLSMGKGKRCMSLKPNGEFCLANIAPGEKLCSSCRLLEDTCVYGAAKLLWRECPKNPKHACFDRDNFGNYLASYGIVQANNSLDLKSGISVNPRSRVRRGGYSFFAILKPDLETRYAEKGDLLPIAALHEIMIPAIALTNRLPTLTVADRFEWSHAVTKNLTNVNFLDQFAYDSFVRQVGKLMEVVWKHCDNELMKSTNDQWEDLRSLLQAAPALGGVAGQKLYESVRSSPLFIDGSDLLSLNISDVYRSLRAKLPVYRYIVHQTCDIDVISEMKRLTKTNEPQDLMTRVRNKPEDLRVKGEILMVRGETMIMMPSDGKPRPHMYRFERLSKGRPVVTWTNLSGVAVNNHGEVGAQTQLQYWS